MATKKEASSEKAAFEVIERLVKAADADTGFRDLYLHRAAELLGAFLTESAYRKLQSDQQRVDVLLRQVKVEVGRQDWARVKALSSQIDLLREEARQKEGLRALAASVYDVEGVRVDPFSTGIVEGSMTKGETTATLRAAVVATLAELAKADPSSAELYGERRRYFEQLAVATAEPGQQKQTAVKKSLAELRREAQSAAEHGEVGRLQQLAEEIMQASAREAEPAEKTAERPAEAPGAAKAAISTEPFPKECLERAGALGLEHLCAKEQVAGFQAAVDEFMAKYSWQPASPAADVAKQGTASMRARLEGVELPPAFQEHKETFVELAALFALHPFINSSGARYFPPAAGEYVLLETFPEDAEPPKDSELLGHLGLSGRRSLARLEIEDALWRRGPAVLRERLGLDPRLFRIVCVPFDVYFRIGAERGWGGQEQWTHVDGYSVQRGGRLGALTAGHARYGGLFDLMILSRTDQRENVVARFAVVRRSRLLTATA